MPVRGSGTIQFQEGRIGIVIDVFLPVFGKCFVGRHPGGEIHFRPGGEVGLVSLVQSFQIPHITAAQIGNKRSVQVKPERMQFSQLGILEFQKILHDGRNIIGICPAGEEVLHGGTDRIPFLIVCIVCLVQSSKSLGTFAELLKQPMTVSALDQGDDPCFIHHSHTAPVMGFVFTQFFQEVPVTFKLYFGGILRHRNVDKRSGRFAQIIEDVGSISVVFGGKVLLIQKFIVIQILGEDAELVKVHAALDGAGDHDQQRVNHGNGPQDQDQVNGKVQ